MKPRDLSPRERREREDSKRRAEQFGYFARKALARGMAKRLARTRTQPKV